MKRKGQKNLTYTQRLQIEALFNVGHTKSEIAKLIGVSVRTIYYELKRGEYLRRDGSTWLEYKSYSPEIAQQKYDFNCTAKGRPIKLGNDYEFINYIENRVATEKITAVAVWGQINHLNLNFKTKISKTTFYRYIKLGIFSNIKLTKRKHKYKKVVIKRAPKGTSIEKRPEYINSRESFGHWEMDCVCGSNKTTILVLSERLTRYEILFKMDNQKSASVIDCLNTLEKQFGNDFKKIFKSITMDNGSEFANYQAIEKSIFGGKRTNTYYCHPYCSSERGTNERLNREIRRLIPKGTALSKYSNNDIKEVEEWLNNYPRSILGYATASELFEQQLQCI